MRKNYSDQKYFSKV